MEHLKFLVATLLVMGIFCSSVSGDAGIEGIDPLVVKQDDMTTTTAGAPALAVTSVIACVMNAFILHLVT
ncbi:unnamed protein product [Notodromas monacha]|uniref:Uncharacterized protein n=1 Tax=Notodromas monacha TaxID=399045 RepID=A0A7R9GET2_9CRUS|nr:unnamed protein product [Notodromas monacha]CAG0920065.1 unnamed protein product [Notodromas monacha]